MKATSLALPRKIIKAIPHSQMNNRDQCHCHDFEGCSGANSHHIPIHPSQLDCADDRWISNKDNDSPKLNQVVIPTEAAVPGVAPLLETKINTLLSNQYLAIDLGNNLKKLFSFLSIKPARSSSYPPHPHLQGTGAIIYLHCPIPKVSTLSLCHKLA